MKTKLTVCFILFFSSLNAQILNAGFEKWDTVFNSFIHSPEDWYTGFLNLLDVKMDTCSFEGDLALKLIGGSGPTDGAIMGIAQQLFLVPEGLDSISFYGKSTYFRPQTIQHDFFGYGLHKDTLDQEQYYNIDDFEVAHFIADTSSFYKRYSFEVPSSLWGEKLHLTFVCEPFSDFWAARPFSIDNIELHIDSTVSTKIIENYSVDIFPNPASDWLYIKDTPPKTKQLEIFSSEGKFVWKGNHLEKLNVSDFKVGNYFLVGKDELGKILFTNSFIKN